MYRTVYNEIVHTGTQIFRAEVDSPEQYVYLHLTPRGPNGRYDCHIGLTWAEATKLAVALYESIAKDVDCLSPEHLEELASIVGGSG
jgi:hypothetical protein